MTVETELVGRHVLPRNGERPSDRPTGWGGRHRQPTLPPAPPRRRTWRSYWWVAAVAAVSAVAVLVDVTTHTTPTYRRSTLQQYLATVDRDVAQCRTGLHDAVVAYVGTVTGNPTVSPGVDRLFTTQGIATCSFTNTGVVSLGSTQPPQVIATSTVDGIAHQVDVWAALDAFTLLQDLRVVIEQPGQLAPRRAFAHELVALRRRRARVEQLVAAAERAVGAPATPMPLTKVTGLLPGGTLPAAEKGGT